MFSLTLLARRKHLLRKWQKKIKVEVKTRTKMSIINALSVIEEATHWMEIIRIEDKTSLETTRTFENEWLCKCLHATTIVHENRSEIDTEFQELLYSHGMQSHAPETINFN